MTPKQASVLQAIRDLTVDGVAPTYHQIMQRAGVGSAGNLCALIDKLTIQGVLTKTHGGARSLRIVEGPSRETMESWSDEEVARVHGIAFDIISDRARREAVAA